MIKIIGAGMAGLLAANMLRHRAPVVIERQSELPNNHSAVLRFRTPVIGDILNTPFKKVTMIKAHVPWRNPIADALAYSFKNSGEYRSDRSIIQGTTVAERWIAPRNLISQMALVEIQLGLNFSMPDMYVSNDTIISTIPMPVLMEELKYPDAPASVGGHQFKSISGVTIKAEIKDCDAYISLLAPDPRLPFSRISITGNELIIEGQKFPIHEIVPVIDEVSKLLGIPLGSIENVTVHKQRYAKILPIDDQYRKQFMHWATDKFGIYSLGRYATWRPGLLLDDLVNDIRLIDRWISQGNYELAKSR